MNLYVASKNYLKMPTRWTHGEGRCAQVLITELTCVIFRGSKDGMLWKIFSPVLETRFGDTRGVPTEAYKGSRNRQGPYRESEGFIVPSEVLGQHNPHRGKEPYFVHATKEWKTRGLHIC